MQQKWEYKVFYQWRNDETQKWNNTVSLNALGDEGWELVTVVSTNNIRTGNTHGESQTWVFKRPKQ